MTDLHFPLPIRGEWLNAPGEKLRYLLLEPFAYVDKDLDIEVLIPAGFITDFNSVPRAFWVYFSPYDVLEAGLVHDWLYDHPDGFTSPSLTPPLSRSQCDNIHRRILDLKGMRPSQRQVVWALLSACGWWAWRKHRQADQKNVQIPPSNS